MKLKDYIDAQRQQADLYEPPAGHLERFAGKLHSRFDIPRKRRIILSLGRKWAVAATLALLLVSGYVKYRNSRTATTDEIRTNRYYSMLIQEKMDAINLKDSPAEKKVYKDAMHRLSVLENAFEKLTRDYRINHDNFILNAMIENYIKRIEILKNLQSQLEQLHQIKTYSNEKKHL